MDILLKVEILQSSRLTTMQIQGDISLQRVGLFAVYLLIDHFK